MPERWLTYRSSDGSLYVDFYFVECENGSGWRIYIISPINYRGHPDGLNITHRAVAALWADVTALYVQGKGTFDEIACKLCR